MSNKFWPFRTNLTSAPDINILTVLFEVSIIYWLTSGTLDIYTLISNCKMIVSCLPMFENLGKHL